MWNDSTFWNFPVIPIISNPHFIKSYLCDNPGAFTSPSDAKFLGEPETASSAP